MVQEFINIDRVILDDFHELSPNDIGKITVELIQRFVYNKNMGDV